MFCRRSFSVGTFPVMGSGVMSAMVQIPSCMAGSLRCVAGIREGGGGVPFRTLREDAATLNYRGGGGNPDVTPVALAGRTAAEPSPLLCRPRVRSVPNDVEPSPAVET